jgi:hypothetical protein
MALAPDDLEGLKRQARGHLDSLRRAGVEWLPAAPQELTLAQVRGQGSGVSTQAPGTSATAEIGRASCRERVSIDV